MATDTKDRVKALEKGIGLLLLLERQRQPLNLETLARHSGLHKTTCFRLLKTMQAHGLVDQEPGTKLYRLGPRLISLGSAAVEGISLRSLARPHLERLRTITGETVNMSVLDGTEVVFVERFESPHILSTHHRIGDRLPVYCTCMGKVILAHLPAARLQEVVDKIAFEPKTPKTITDRQQLLRELEQIRERGLAYNLEELEKGLCAVAAPVLARTGEAVAAINVAFPLVRHELQAALEQFSPLVQAAAGEISATLGYSERTGGASAGGEPWRH